MTETNPLRFPTFALRLTAPPDRPRRARRLRAADRALDWMWGAGLTVRPVLEADALIRSIEGATDLPDRCGWRRRLDILCEDLAHSANLTPLGHAIAYGQLAGTLRQRVRLQALWSRHPDILDQPLASPIIIVGQMRSGSTRLQRLLACDPRFAATRFFESWHPIPRSADRPAVDDRPWRARVALTITSLLNPGFGAIHPTAWNAPDEEIGWHNLSFFGAAYEAQWRVPRLTADVEDGDALPVYAEFRRLLQTVAWLRGEGGARRWILKIPQFTQDLPALMRVFPDATLIRLDRDLASVVASSASLVRNQMEIQSAAPCPRWLGRETLRKVALRHRRTEAALARATGPGLRVDYGAMDEDWRGEMERVYRILGLPLTAPVRAAMAGFLRRAEGHALHRHRYALADYGLTAGEVHAALADPEPAKIAAA